MQRMLINATQKEEMRVALVDGQALYDLYIEPIGREEKKSNIYKGKITRVEPSLEAVFVDYGAERHGFLPFKEIAPNYLVDKNSPRDSLKEGLELMVQVEKEERGNKGAALTTFISLPGCYLVLMPNDPRAGGISRRIDGNERDELREVISNLQVPEGMGFIVRTAGVGKSEEELQWDLAILLRHWEAIQNAYQQIAAPALIHQESDVVIRAIRDYLRKDINEILIDNPDIYQRAQRYIQMVRPDYVQRVKLYSDTVPLFSRFHIESQIESAFHREVRLPSGGVMVIDQTEALTAIDINSARSTRGGDIEETALHTNIEAAEEIARQLRIRDLGGLLVIDFIDMTPIRNQRAVEDKLREALKLDRARVQVGRISHFGLLEMSRQRLRPSLEEYSQINCPRCHGSGIIRGVESLALSVMRLIEEEAMKERTAQVHAQLPVEVATFLLNEKRQVIVDLETRHQVHIVLIPNIHLETPEYKVERLRHDEASSHLSGDSSVSYKMVHRPEIALPAVAAPQPTIATQQPAVKPLDITPPQASRQTAKKTSLLKRLFAFLFSGENKTAATPHRKQATHHTRRNNPQRGEGGANRNNRRTRSSGNRRDGQGQGRTRYEQRDQQTDRKRHDNTSQRNLQNKPKVDNTSNPVVSNMPQAPTTSSADFNKPTSAITTAANASTQAHTTTELVSTVPGVFTTQSSIATLPAAENVQTDVVTASETATGTTSDEQQRRGRRGNRRFHNRRRGNSAKYQPNRPATTDDSSSGNNNDAGNTNAAPSSTGSREDSSD